MISKKTILTVVGAVCLTLFVTGLVLTIVGHSRAEYNRQAVLMEYVEDAGLNYASTRNYNERMFQSAVKDTRGWDMYTENGHTNYGYIGDDCWMAVASFASRKECIAFNARGPIGFVKHNSSMVHATLHINVVGVDEYYRVRLHMVKAPNSYYYIPKDCWYSRNVCWRLRRFLTMDRGYIIVSSNDGEFVASIPTYETYKEEK